MVWFEQTINEYFCLQFQRCFDEIQRKAVEEETITSDCEADMSDSENDRSKTPLKASEQSSGEETFDYTKTVEYRELLAELRNNLTAVIKSQLKNSSALIRRATILLLEFVATTSLQIDSLLKSHVCKHSSVQISRKVNRTVLISL